MTSRLAEQTKKPPSIEGAALLFQFRFIDPRIATFQAAQKPSGF
jgi:hypothetical protein